MKKWREWEAANREDVGAAKKCHYAKYWGELRDFRFSFCCHPHRLLNIKEFMKLSSLVGSLHRALDTAGILSQASSRGGFISASFISMFKAVNKQKAHKSYQFAYGVCITFSSTIYSILDFFMLQTGNKKKVRSKHKFHFYSSEYLSCSCFTLPCTLSFLCILDIGDDFHVR